MSNSASSVPKPDMQDCCRAIYKILLNKQNIFYTDLAKQVGVETPQHTCLREITYACIQKGLPPITALVVGPVEASPLAKECERLDAAWYGLDG